jgi:uncharacterized protein
VNPFYFGPSKRPLFGVFSQARGAQSRPGAVLLCYPILGEYLRAHRAFRQLNTLLNRSGLSVLRFDYSCTGDSAGRGEDARLEEWIDDVGWAVDELKDMVGADQVSLVGLRFGASIAALASQGRSDVDRLILWDPIVSGESFVEATVGPDVGEATVGVEGVPMTASLRTELSAVDLSRLDGLSPRGASVVVAADDPSYRVLMDRLQAMNVETDFEVVPSKGSWTEADPFGSAYIPEQIIQTVVGRLTAASGVLS